jgi:hypothetical protein
MLPCRELPFNDNRLRNDPQPFYAYNKEPQNIDRSTFRWNPSELVWKLQLRLSTYREPKLNTGKLRRARKKMIRQSYVQWNSGNLQKEKNKAEKLVL